MIYIPLRSALAFLVPLAAAFAALFAAVAVAAAAPAPKSKVIIDQDGGGAAVLMVLQDPAIDVLGITEVSGDTYVKESVARVLRMLELIGRPEVPVVPGATFPLVNTEEETRRWEALYGKLTWKGAWMDQLPDYDKTNVPAYHAPDVIPPLAEGRPTLKPSPEIAANFLVRKVREFPGQVAVLAMGPFTNLALACRLDESFAANARELVIMGGSFNPHADREDVFTLQFIHSPRTEFNCRWDPEAVRIMLHAGWRKITVIPFDPCVDTLVTPALLARATAGGRPAARYAAANFRAGFPLWDEAAAAVLLDPAVARVTSQLAMDIDIGHGANYGSILSWPAGRGPGLGEPVVTVVRALDVPRLERLYCDLLNR
jgi:inosine-uridine nucleoside N-ribohydrolase